MSRVLFQPSVRYLSGNGPMGFFDLNQVSTDIGKTLQQTTAVGLKWFEPETSIALLDKGISAFKTVTGQGAQEQAQANLLSLQQARAQSELAAGAQFQQTIQAALPWVIGGAVIVTGIVVLSKVLK